nr:uncharacterized protein LOC129383452 [Dermacentor andersoni]
MSLAETINTKAACHAPSKVVDQVEVGMQCSLPLADKSVGCCFKAWSVSRSMQTMEAPDQLSSTSGLHWRSRLAGPGRGSPVGFPGPVRRVSPPKSTYIEAFYFSINCQL